MSLNFVKFVTIILLLNGLLQMLQATQVEATSTTAAVEGCGPIHGIVNGTVRELIGGCINCNSSSDDDGTQVDKAWYKSGTVFQLQCNEGFRIDSGDKFTVCLQNGTWSPKLGWCESESLCLLPQTPANAEIVKWSEGTSTFFRPGQFVEYACKHNYEMKGRCK